MATKKGSGAAKQAISAYKTGGKAAMKASIKSSAGKTTRTMSASQTQKRKNAQTNRALGMTLGGQIRQNMNPRSARGQARVERAVARKNKK